MAGNYVESSFAIENLTEEEMAWWRKEQEREFPHDVEIEEVEPAMSLDFAVVMEDSQVWFHGDPSLNVDCAADVIQRFLKEFRPNGSVGFTWSETCSKPRLDEFGGGACFITAENVEWNSANGWLNEKQTEFAGREKGNQ